MIHLQVVVAAGGDGIKYRDVRLSMRLHFASRLQHEQRKLPFLNNARCIFNAYC
jgi:hypothetical protein